jgi:hypothetical protein
MLFILFRVIRVSGKRYGQGRTTVKEVTTVLLVEYIYLGQEENPFKTGSGSRKGNT